MKKIILFTKPYVNKNMYVEITYDQDCNTYELNGIDVYGQNINEVSTNYSTIMYSFYKELCWMINQNIMANTFIQRIHPESASIRYKLTKNN